MPFKLLLIVLKLWISYSSQPGCPVISCKPLSKKFCAELNGKQLFINSDPPFSDDYACSLLQIVTAYNQIPKITPTTRYEFPVRPKPKPDDFGGYNSWHIKYKWNENNTLAEGTHPKPCQIDKDCLLIIGEYGFCNCGFDGNYYCQPKIDDIPGVREESKDNNDNTMALEHWVWYKRKVNYYVWTKVLPECAIDLLYDVKEYSRRKP
ncbi:unnamed protein product [Blepharisma stoltei]|uniref:EGF-like domain-containing protein n=1 Tax=Blepharisma stoltei TaxID=1481888 RepID=A0AAU9KE88_9CILI|nr:unnamed protein product [Blepharisma stoltei]